MRRIRGYLFIGVALISFCSCINPSNADVVQTDDFEFYEGFVNDDGCPDGEWSYATQDSVYHNVFWTPDSIFLKDRVQLLYSKPAGFEFQDRIESINGFVLFRASPDSLLSNMAVALYSEGDASMEELLANELPKYTQLFENGTVEILEGYSGDSRLGSFVHKSMTAKNDLGEFELEFRVVDLDEDLLFICSSSPDTTNLFFHVVETFVSGLVVRRTAQ